MRRSLTTATALLFAGLSAAGAGGSDQPSASIDLATRAGVEMVGGEWRYSDVAIVETRFRAADEQGQPTGDPVATWDYEPRGGIADLDDASWQLIEPETLDERRGHGRLSFNWYRIRVTIPERIGSFDPTGSTVWFDTSLDDYAEIWVDGELPRAFAQSGGSVVGGWNANNRLVVGRNVKPGQEIQLAIFGINGPISGSPTNFIWMRHAKLDFYPGAKVPLAVVAQEVNVEVERRHPAIDRIVPANPKVFKLAEGFAFIEGPVWLASGELLFSDPNENRIYRFAEAEGRPGNLSVFRERSGYAGDDVARYTQPGSNGLAIDPLTGRLTIDEHGNRRVTQLDADGSLEVLADRYRGKRLNSPNDLVFRSDGTLYFTDPPFGLPGFYDDPSKELEISGIYRAQAGEVELVASDLAGPNGLAFSPDERFLYVSNWDPSSKIVMRYPVRIDGTLGRGRVFFDMTGAPGEEALDGLKVDVEGNLYVSGPGGLWILDDEGRHLGTVRLPKLAANFAWGGADGRTLYLTARSTLYRMTLNIPGSPARADVAAAVLK